MSIQLWRRPLARATARLARLACIACIACNLGVATSALAQSGATDVAHFDVYAEGDTIHLLTGHGKKGGPSILLYHRVSKDAGASWSKAVRVNAGTERLSAHHPGENPSIAGNGNRIVVAWTAPRPNARRGGLIQTAVSDDGGATWKNGPSPFSDAAGSQTFMRMVAAANSGGAAARAMHMVWLDSRDGRQGLRYAKSDDLGASWGKDAALVPLTCDCCWNSVATRPAAGGASEVSVLYRGGDPRDMMHMASASGAKWSAPSSIGGFDWRVNGCPHVGGALVARGNTLHTLVWTGKDGVLGLYHASLAGAGDAGSAANWSKPKKLGTDDAKNADLTVMPDGSLVAVWDESTGRGSPLRMAKSTDGTTWSAPETIAAHREATHPRVVATSTGAAVFWFEGSPWNSARLLVNGREISAP